MQHEPYFCGLGLRSDFIDDIYAHALKPSWFEITPENWMTCHFKHQKLFERIVSDFTIAAHGLSLSIGSNTPLNKVYLQSLKSFLDRYNIQYYSEHLSFSAFDGNYLHELLPLPMSEAMVQLICERIDAVQNALGRPIALENATFYYQPYQEMSESDFMHAIITRSGCNLLLDINNVYVNAHNHGFDAKSFLHAMPLEQIAYMHVAGHITRSDETKIDTHSESVCDDVWQLLDSLVEQGINKPLLLERDSNIPPYDELLGEYSTMKTRYQPNKSTYAND